MNMGTLPLPLNPAPSLQDLQSGDLLFLKKPGERVAALVSEGAVSDAPLAVQDLHGPSQGLSLDGFLADLNLTVSHVAMAFEEDGQWYVMEAGCTDYSHYRVCISPFEDVADALCSPAQKRGWVARRLALGQCVWSARHKDLTPQQVSMIVNHCKNFLSVPYGILEPGMMHSCDRLYCSELLRNGFASVGLAFDANQNWGWVVRQLGQSKGLLDLAMDLILRKAAFPLLSPKMIYDDPRMVPAFRPGPDGAKLAYL